MSLRESAVEIVLRVKNFLSPGVDAASKSLDGLKGEAGRLGKELAELEKQQAAVKAFDRLSEAVKASGAELKEAKQKVDQLKASFKESKDPDIAIALERAKTEAREAGKAFSGNIKELAELRRVLKGAGIDMDDLAKAETQINQKLAETRNSARAAGVDLDKLGAEAGRAEIGFKTLAKALLGYATLHLSFGAITSAIGRASRAAADFVSSGVSGAIDLEAQLAKVRAVTSANAEDMALLKRAAEDAGKTTQFSAVQAAEGLEILGQAGKSAQESVQLLPVLLRTATAAGVDLAQSAGILTDTLTIMGLATADAGRAADVLAKTANASNATMQDLGLALQYAGANARTAGLDLEQLSAAMGILANNGLRGEKAGTALRSILAQLSDPASKAGRELSLLGERSGTLAGALNAIREAGANGQRAISAFGLEAGPALQALLAASTGQLAELEKTLRNAGGAAEAAAHIMGDTTEGALKRLSAAWDYLKTKLGDPLLKPIAEEAAKLAKSLVDLGEGEGVKALGEGLAEAFRNAATAAREFFRDVDFTKLGKETGETVKELADDVNTVATAASVTGNALSIVANGVTGAFHTLVAGFSGFLAAHLDLTGQLLQKLGGDKLGGELRAIGDSLSDNARHHLDLLRQDGEDIQRAFEGINKRLEDNARQGAAAVSKPSQEAVAHLAAIVPAADAVKAKIQQAFASGAISIEQYVQQIADADRANQELAAATEKTARAQAEQKDKTESATRELEALNQAASILGMDTLDTLQRKAAEASAAFQTFRDSKEPIEQVQAAFMKWAEAEVAVAAASGGTVSSALLEQAATLGLTDAVYALIEARLKDFRIQQEIAQGKIKGLKNGVDAVQDAADKERDIQEKAAEEARKRSAALGNFFKSHIEANAKELQALSAEAVAAYMAQFTAGKEGVVDLAKASLGEIQRLATEARAETLDAGIKVQHAFNTIFNRFAAEQEEAAARVKEAFYSQLAQAKELSEQLKDVNHVTAESLVRAEEAMKGFDLLGDQQLEPLRRAIEDARDQFRELSEEIRDETADLQDELDRLLGNEADIKFREYQRRLAELQTALEQAQRSGNRDLIEQAERNIEILRRIHELEQGQPPRPTTPTGTPSASQPPPATPPRQASGGQGFVITFAGPGGPRVQAATHDEDEARRLLRLLEEAGATLRG